MSLELYLMLYYILYYNPNDMAQKSNWLLTYYHITNGVIIALRYPAVIITPNDLDLINEGSVSRRKFVDGIISQYNKEYLYDLIDYNKILLQRNNLLKHFKQEGRFDQESIEIWDVQLVSLAHKIHRERIGFIENFKPTLNLINLICAMAKNLAANFRKSKNLNFKFKFII